MPFRPTELEGVEIRPLNRHADERGWLAEIFRSDDVGPEGMPVMGYLSVTKPGESRGPHEHVQQTDWFCFPGPGTFEVRMWDNRPRSTTYTLGQTLVVGGSEPAMILIPPGVVHGYRNIGDEQAMVLNFPNRLYAGEGRREPVDEIRHEVDARSPFQMQ